MNNPLYTFAINNVARKIRSVENKMLIEENSPELLDAFKAATILSIAFVKVYEDVVLDLTMAEL